MLPWFHSLVAPPPPHLHRCQHRASFPRREEGVEVWRVPTPIPSASIISSSGQQGEASICIIRREVPLISVVLCLDAMVPWRMEARLAETVWVALLGWVSSCLTVAGDVARALRSSDLSV
ncbi:hypothetical protein ZWY2020_016638 [Hordeum vulgare]|nr:hypothetical protein ZWY2020_016638 [Hordeum vulgare]